MHIVLIGYRCAGKTTVGRIVAERLGLRFFDTDKLVEAKAKMPISRIFEEAGEGEFRRLESEVIEEISGGDGKVIAVGGGGVIRQRNVTNLKKGGKLFFLQVSPEEVRKRLDKDPAAVASRPPLIRDDVVDEAREMIGRRERFYREAADFTIVSNGRTPEDVAEEVMRKRDAEPEKKDDDDTRHGITREKMKEGRVKKPTEGRSDSTGGHFPRES